MNFHILIEEIIEKIRKEKKTFLSEIREETKYLKKILKLPLSRASKKGGKYEIKRYGSILTGFYLPLLSDLNLNIRIKKNLVNKELVIHLRKKLENKYKYPVQVIEISKGFRYLFYVKNTRKNLDIRITINFERSTNLQIPYYKRFQKNFPVFRSVVRILKLIARVFVNPRMLDEFEMHMFHLDTKDDQDLYPCGYFYQVLALQQRCKIRMKPFMTQTDEIYEWLKSCLLFLSYGEKNEFERKNKDHKRIISIQEVGVVEEEEEEEDENCNRMKNIVFDYSLCKFHSFKFKMKVHQLHFRKFFQEVYEMVVNNDYIDKLILELLSEEERIQEKSKSKVRSKLEFVSLPANAIMRMKEKEEERGKREEEERIMKGSKKKKKRKKRRKNEFTSQAENIRWRSSLEDSLFTSNVLHYQGKILSKLYLK